MCCEGCGEDAPCTMPAKFGIGSLILFIISFILGIVFSFDIITDLDGEDFKNALLLGVVLPSCIGIVISIVAIVCMPNSPHGYCFYRCKNGKTLPAVTFALNAVVAVIWGSWAAAK